jgi:hypothetical protein
MKKMAPPMKRTVSLKKRMTILFFKMASRLRHMAKRVSLTAI